MVYLAFGTLMGPQLLGWLDLHHGSEALKIIAELTLALVLFSDAADADLATLRKSFRIPQRLLLIGGRMHAPGSATWRRGCSARSARTRHHAPWTGSRSSGARAAAVSSRSSRGSGGRASSQLPSQTGEGPWTRRMVPATLASDGGRPSLSGWPTLVIM